MNEALLLAARQGLMVIRKTWFGFPEGRLKERLRKLGLRFFKNFPIELTLRKGEIAVQVGATPRGDVLTMAQIVGGTGRVIAIEAETGNLEALRKNLEGKSLKNVTLVPKGETKVTYMPLSRGP